MSRESRQAEAEEQMRQSEADWEMRRYEERRRDLFAAHAMQTFMTSPEAARYDSVEDAMKAVATKAFEMADAMLAASESK